MRRAYHSAALTLTLVSACGSDDVGDGLDAGDAGDAQPFDAAPFDAGRPDAAGSTPCRAYCLDLAAEREAFHEEQLRSHGDANCSVATEGLEGCVAYCESRAPSAECLECEREGIRSCIPICGPNKGVYDARWPIEMMMPCWIGASRPAESCTESAGGRSGFADLGPAPPGQLQYTGSASVASANPLSVRLPTGRTIGIVPQPTVPLFVGDIVSLELDASCPFGCSSAYVLRTATGAFVQAAWRGLSPIALPELALDYAVDSCVGVAGRFSSTIDLNLISGGTAISPGSGLRTNGVMVYNGPSAIRYAHLATDLIGNGRYGLVQPE